MRSARIVLMALAAVSLSLIGLTACGGTSGPKVAGAGGSTPGASSSAQSGPAALWSAYAQCLRQHGFNEPDPTLTGKGMPHWQVSLDTAPPSVKQACQSYLNNAITRGQGPPSAQLLQKEVRLSQCMRQHGVPGFPDPDPQTGGLNIQGIDTQSPQFQSAFQACNSQSPHGGAG